MEQLMSNSNEWQARKEAMLALSFCMFQHVVTHSGGGVTKLKFAFDELA